MTLMRGQFCQLNYRPTLDATARVELANLPVRTGPLCPLSYVANLPGSDIPTTSRYLAMPAPVVAGETVGSVAGT